MELKSEPVRRDQEVFNKAYVHLLTQNAKSMEPGFGCLYRSAGGLKCAVGCLIPNELYSEGLEGEAAEYLCQRDARLYTVLGGASESLLIALQSCHDHYDPPSWPTRLAEIAGTYGLTIPVMP